MCGKKRLALILLAILMIFTSFLLPAGCNNALAETSRWTDLLGVIPANQDTLKSAYLRDDILKRDMMELYSSSQPVNSFDYYFFPASGGNINTRDYNDSDWTRDLGFTEEDISRVILAGELEAPPFPYYQAAQGQFDKRVIENAVKTGSLHEKLEIVKYHGQDYYSAGVDNAIDLTVQSAAHPLGMAYRMAVLDDTILFSNRTGQIEEMLDAAKNRTDSLGDNETYQELSKILDDLNTFYAFFSDESYSLMHIKQLYEDYKNDHQLNDATIKMMDERMAELEKSILLKPFEALASGIGLDENGYYLVIAMANADEATARQNATLLEQRLDQASDPQLTAPWTTFMDGKREISDEGDITTAKIYGEAYKLWKLSVYEAPMWGFFLDAFLVTE
jgi:hypothetical protein